VTVVDSSVAVASTRVGDALHEAAQAALHESGSSSRLVLPAVAFAEVMVGAIRGGRERRSMLQRQLRVAFTVEPLTEVIAVQAAEVRARYGLPLPDALVLATGLELGATAILTGDRRWRKVHRSVVVVRRGAQGRRSARRRVEDHENHP
jgi:predicted nucleic acid-binding protein